MRTGPARKVIGVKRQLNGNPFNGEHKRLACRPVFVQLDWDGDPSIERTTFEVGQRDTLSKAGF